MIELLYNLKKYIIKKWKMYFTTEGTYTCILPDKLYLQLLYKKRTGETLNLREPKTYNEKLNWLKLYDRRPEYTMMVDKYAAREYVKNVVGEEYLIPLIGCWDSVADIDIEALPNEFVLKCNHDNGVIICRDKKSFDFTEAKKFLDTHLSRNYYKKAREWPYKNIVRKIICEKYIEDEKEKDLLDYKFFCFDGCVKLFFIGSDRQNGVKFDFFDTDFTPIPIINGHPNGERIFEKPKNFDEMKQIAEMLSKDIPHVRVDLYNIDGKIYFSELTLYHYAGFVPFYPNEWNEILGNYINLPKDI